MGTLRLEQPELEAVGHEGEALTCAYLPDHTCVLSGGWDGTLRLWDAGRGSVLDTLAVADKPVSACAVAPDGKLWLVGTMDGLLSVWDAETRQRKTMFLAHTRPVAGLVFSPDGTQLASASWDRSVSLWTLGAKVEGRTVGHHGDIVAGCCFTPDGARLVSWAYDGTVGVWDVADKRRLAEIHAHDDRVTAGAVAPDGRWLVTGSRACEVRLWEMRYGQPAAVAPLEAEVRGCWFLLDAARLVVLDANGRLTVHGVPGLEVEDELLTRLPVQSGALSPAGGQVALCTAEGRVALVTLDGYDTAPLAVTATQSVRLTATLFDKLLGRRHVEVVSHCVCPACRSAFDLPGDRTEASCPNCHRALRVCAVSPAHEHATI